MYRFSVGALTLDEAANKLRELANRLSDQKVNNSVTDSDFDDEEQMFETASPTPVVRTTPEPASKFNTAEPKVVVTPSVTEEEEDDEGPAPRKHESPASHDLTDRDSRGFPWDARIHSAKKTKAKDGTWRTRRNLEEGALEMVERELRARYINGLVKPSAPASEPQRPPAAAMEEQKAAKLAAPTMYGQQGPAAPKLAVVPPPPASTVHVEMPVNVAPPMPQDQSPINYDTPVPMPTAGARPAYDLPSFKKNFVSFMTSLINDGKINRDYVLQLNSYFGISDIWEITKDDTKTEEIFNNFAAAGFLTKVG